MDTDILKDKLREQKMNSSWLAVLMWKEEGRSMLLREFFLFTERGAYERPLLTAEVLALQMESRTLFFVRIPIAYQHECN